MYPALLFLRLGGHELGLHTYGVLVALGLAVGVVLFWREGQRQGLDGGRLLDLAFWSIVAGLVGSRLAFIALNAGAFIDACADAAMSGHSRLSGCTAALRFWEGGFVFYGGGAAASFVVLMFCRGEGWSFWRIGDLVAPTLAIGHAIGRLGCFFAGCCFGKACSGAWGVSFPNGSVAYDELQSVGVLPPGAPLTPPLHPTQLYEAAGELAIFAILVLLRRRWGAGEANAAESTHGARPSRRAPGGLLLCYVAAYAALRFVVEIFRGDVSRRFVAEWHWASLAGVLGLPPGEALFLSVSQLASLVMFLGAVGVTLWRRFRLSVPVVSGGRVISR